MFVGSVFVTSYVSSMMSYIPVKFYGEILGQTVCYTTRDFGITILLMRVSFLADQLLRVFFFIVSIFSRKLMLLSFISKVEK